VENATRALARFYVQAHNPKTNAALWCALPSAGEVEQFAYCAHNWWLARGGVDTHAEGSKRGMEDHRRLGKAQEGVEREKKEYRYAWQAALSIILLALSGVLAAIALQLRGRADVTALVVVAIVLALGSSGLLTLALFAQAEAQRRTRRAGLVPGHLVASDLAGEAPLLKDSTWDLAGRPDYILQTRTGPVPVEVKTGRTPDRPHRSHQLQVACYLRLLEASGKVPEYGIVSYPQGVFRVEWSDALRADLQKTLDAMRQAEADGRADRDHDQAARCRGCARRDACDQKLA